MRAGHDAGERRRTVKEEDRDRKRHIGGRRENVAAIRMQEIFALVVRRSGVCWLMQMLLTSDSQH